MSKKHFVDIARALATIKADINVCRAIAWVCARHNRNFDYRRFMVACGIDPRE